MKSVDKSGENSSRLYSIRKKEGRKQRNHAHTTQSKIFTSLKFLIFYAFLILIQRLALRVLLLLLQIKRKWVIK